jgi:hypothetical protein
MNVAREAGLRKGWRLRSLAHVWTFAFVDGECRASESDGDSDQDLIFD